MMEFKIIVEESQLQGDDASLSLGWFKIVERDFTIHLFSERHCMVFITLTSFLEVIEALKGRRKGEGRLVGEDNGKVIKVLKENDVIELIGESLTFKTNFNLFMKSTIRAAGDLINHCKKTNKNIVKESAFKDLLSVYGATE